MPRSEPPKNKEDEKPSWERTVAFGRAHIEPEDGPAENTIVEAEAEAGETVFGSMADKPEAKGVVVDIDTTIRPPTAAEQLARTRARLAMSGEDAASYERTQVLTPDDAASTAFFARGDKGDQPNFPLSEAQLSRRYLEAKQELMALDTKTGLKGLLGRVTDRGRKRELGKTLSILRNQFAALDVRVNPDLLTEELVQEAEAKAAQSA